MSSLAKAVNFDTSTMWVDFTDGRKLGVPLAYFGMNWTKISALKTSCWELATEPEATYWRRKVAKLITKQTHANLMRT